MKVIVYVFSVLMAVILGATGVAADEGGFRHQSARDLAYCETICIDFSKADNGTILGHGDYVQDEWLNAYSMTIEASTTMGGYTPNGMARIYDTSKKGEDPDLGSPNRMCGGHGVGAGGAPEGAGPNCNPDGEGNVLIIQESDKPEPDDNAQGGIMAFIFDCPVYRMRSIGLIDVDVGEQAFFEIFQEGGGAPMIQKIVGKGENSIQKEKFYGIKDVNQVKLVASNSFGVRFICFCPGNCIGRVEPPVSGSTGPTSAPTIAPTPPQTSPVPTVTGSTASPTREPTFAPASQVYVTYSVRTIERSDGSVYYVFTVTVQNSSGSSVELTRLEEETWPDFEQNGGCDAMPQTIPPDEQFVCQFQVEQDAGEIPPSTTITGYFTDKEGNTVVASDEALITYDVESSLSVMYTAMPETITEPGGAVKLNVTVSNVGESRFGIVSMYDSEHGNLWGKGDCTPVAPNFWDVEAGSSYTCSYEVDVVGSTVGTFSSILEVVVANQEFSLTAEDSVAVDITDAPVPSPIPTTPPTTPTPTPTIMPTTSSPAPSDAEICPAFVTVAKIADPPFVIEPGAEVIFTIVIKNSSILTTSVVMESIIDDLYGDLDGQGDCTLPQNIPASSKYVCRFTAAVVGNAGDEVTGQIVASGIDEHGNIVSDMDTESVTVIASLETKSPAPTTAETNSPAPTTAVTDSPAPTPCVCEEIDEAETPRRTLSEALERLGKIKKLKDEQNAKVEELLLETRVTLAVARFGRMLADYAESSEVLSVLLDWLRCNDEALNEYEEKLAELTEVLHAILEIAAFTSEVATEAEKKDPKTEDPVGSKVDVKKLQDALKEIQRLLEETDPDKIKEGLRKVKKALGDPEFLAKLTGIAGEVLDSLISAAKASKVLYDNLNRLLNGEDVDGEVILDALDELPDEANPLLSVPEKDRRKLQDIRRELQDEENPPTEERRAELKDALEAELRKLMIHSAMNAWAKQPVIPPQKLRSRMLITEEIGGGHQSPSPDKDNEIAGKLLEAANHILNGELTEVELRDAIDELWAFFTDDEQVEIKKILDNLEDGKLSYDEALEDIQKLIYGILEDVVRRNVKEPIEALKQKIIDEVISWGKGVLLDSSLKILLKKVFPGLSKAKLIKRVYDTIKLWMEADKLLELEEQYNQAMNEVVQLASTIPKFNVMGPLHSNFIWYIFDKCETDPILGETLMFFRPEMVCWAPAPPEADGTPAGEWEGEWELQTDIKGLGFSLEKPRWREEENFYGKEDLSEDGRAAAKLLTVEVVKKPLLVKDCLLHFHYTLKVPPCPDGKKPCYIFMHVEARNRSETIHHDELVGVRL